MIDERRPGAMAVVDEERRCFNLEAFLWWCVAWPAQERVARKAGKWFRDSDRTTPESESLDTSPKRASPRSAQPPRKKSSQLAHLLTDSSKACHREHDSAVSRCRSGNGDNVNLKRRKREGELVCAGRASVGETKIESSIAIVHNVRPAQRRRAGIEDGLSLCPFWGLRAAGQGDRPRESAGCPCGWMEFLQGQVTVTVLPRQYGARFTM